jgi:hypothetical protein
MGLSIGPQSVLDKKTQLMSQNRKKLDDSFREYKRQCVLQHQVSQSQAAMGIIEAEARSEAGTCNYQYLELANLCI